MKLKSKKSALLLSFTSLLLCFAMLAGSTFAWFTDTATTGVNKIVSGNLKVDIVDENGAHLNDLSFQDKDSKTDIRWEPGVKFLTQGFKIKNDGNLALKWKMAVNKGVKGETDDFDLKDVIDFSIVTIDNTTVTPVEKEVDLAAFEGKLPSGMSEVYYLKGHMQESAGNDYQNLSLNNITVTVYATQLNSEFDSFNNTYDEGAEYNPTIVTSSDEAEIALSANKENIYVDLARDVSFDVNEGENKLLGGVDTKLIVIDGKGCKLTFNNKNNNSGIVSREGTKLVIKNAVIDNSGYNEAGGTWDTHDIIFNNHNSEVRLENVTFTNAVALSGKATLTDVKISDKKATQAACLLWIVEGSQVELNNVTIDGKSTVGKENRAIAIKNQYVPGKYGNGGNTTLTVNGLTATSDKYAAIYVTSNNATTVNLNGAIDITETAVNDTVVQRGSNSTGEITVNDNSTKVVKAASQDELANAITSVEAGKSAKVDLGAGTYTLPEMSGKDVTIVGTKDTVIDVSTGSAHHGATIALEGVTVKGQTSGNFEGLKHTAKVVYKDCKITEKHTLYAKDTEFVNCVFEQTAADYNLWTYGGNVTFTDCTFISNGKFINAYRQQNTADGEVTNLTLTNCKFVNTGSANKAAVNIKSQMAWNVIITSCTTEGEFPAENNGLWQSAPDDGAAEAPGNKVTVN